MKSKVLFRIIPLVLLLYACAPGDLRLPQSPALPFLERKSGLIAYLGTDGNLYVSDQAGGKLLALTKDGKLPETEKDDFLIYQHPAWSSDGRYLAYAGLSREADTASSELNILDMVSNKTTQIYRSTTEVPYYLFWSPDNANLSFLSTAASGQTQILQNISANGERRIIDTGSPIYWSWAPDGRVMIVHAGDPGTGEPADKTAFLLLDRDVTEIGLDVKPAPFQSPGWSPDGKLILYAVVPAGNDYAIIMAEGDGSNPQEMATFSGKAAFVWSPDSQKFAYIDSDETTDTGALGNLQIVDVVTKEVHTEERNVIAFFWSPDSRSLAYFVPYLDSSSASSEDQSADLLLELNILDAESGESRKILTYKPTSQFADLLPFFDQYHQSMTIWSPDSNNLVVSFVDSEAASGIAVVAASGRLEPRFLAEGLLAVWSWR